MISERVKIVVDSSADLLSLSDVAFEVAPLKVITAKKEYADTVDLNVKAMVEEMAAYKGTSSTSCPNVVDWLNAFGESEEIYCLTITGTLSGSHNAAMNAKKFYEEKHPDRRVFVLDTLSAGPEIGLMAQKLRELILAGKEFDAICRAMRCYRQKTGLLFMLESMKNLANNGRVSPLVAKMAGLLGIRVVGKASDKGDLEPLEKCRGEHKALDAIVAHMQAAGWKKGRIRIAHCFNETAAEKLRGLLRQKSEQARIEIYPCRGLCSFYAEQGGLLVGFEKI